MIARLEGKLCALAPTRVVIDVGGVGYEVLIPLSTFTELPDAGKTVVLLIHTHMRDSSIQLFGFATECERVAFELLLRANRVGPKLAQTVLSGISPVVLLEAIRSGKVAVLRAVPGVGSKMAERILMELRDNVGELAAAVAATGATPADAPLASSADVLYEQTLSALLNLGYAKAQAERVLEQAAADAGDDPTLESLVRASLRYLAK